MKWNAARAVNIYHNSFICIQYAYPRRLSVHSHAKPSSHAACSISVDNMIRIRFSELITTGDAEKNAVPSQQSRSVRNESIVLRGSVATCLSRCGGTSTSVRRRRKNIDSSSKSNPLRRRRENYDASTWRCIGVVVEKNEESRRTFNKNYYDLLTAITELLIVHSRSIITW